MLQRSVGGSNAGIWHQSFSFVSRRQRLVSIRRPGLTRTGTPPDQLCIHDFDLVLQHNRGAAGCAIRGLAFRAEFVPAALDYDQSAFFGKLLRLGAIRVAPDAPCWGIRSGSFGLFPVVVTAGLRVELNRAELRRV